MEAIKMDKSQLLKQWKDTPKTNPAPLMRPLPYKSEGSTYGEDGVRIDGSPEFIFAVLSNLKGLLVWENESTRLSASFAEIAARHKAGDKVVFGEGTGSYCCYIRAARRRREGFGVRIVPADYQGD